MTYLDWASTAPPAAGILGEAAAVASELYGNPSSRHGLGASAKARLEEARRRLASAIPGSPEPSGIVFTSGGSEADSIPLLALLRSALGARRDGSIKRLRLVTTEIEHAAVYEQAHLLKSLGLDVVFVRPEADGRIDPEKVGAAVDKDTALVAVMAVNNETGAVQELKAIAGAIARASSAYGRGPPRFHSDAVQALGKVELDPIASGLSSMALSAHKVRGPRGAGALWTSAPIESLALGGGQERSMRPGTESLQGAWAFAAAAEAANSGFAGNMAKARGLEARLLAGIGTIPGALALPLGRQPGDPRYSPFILSLAFPGLSGEVLARALSDLGVAVSTGSACSSNAKKPGRRVLAAMSLPEDLTLSAIRVSTGSLSTEAEVDLFLEAASRAYRKLKT
jgi:cysteine desulfurase